MLQEIESPGILERVGDQGPRKGRSVRCLTSWPEKNSGGIPYPAEFAPVLIQDKTWSTTVCIIAKLPHYNSIGFFDPNFVFSIHHILDNRPHPLLPHAPHPWEQLGQHIKKGGWGAFDTKWCLQVDIAEPLFGRAGLFGCSMCNPSWRLTVRRQGPVRNLCTRLWSGADETQSVLVTIFTSPRGVWQISSSSHVELVMGVIETWPQ